MRVLHVSESFNRSSILEKGLLPSRVLLPQHLEVWRELDLCTPDGKILYTWESCNKDDKFIKDMVFCKQFLHPRNVMPYDTDYSKLLTTFMGSAEHMTYDVYEATVPDHESLFTHVQTPELSVTNSAFGMPYEFAHNDKTLHVFKEPLKDLRIVGSAEFEYKGDLNYVVRTK